MLSEGLDLRKLRAFQLVARHGGLRAAAKRLQVTVPAVSFLIRKLEDELGVELFQRLPRGLSLTPAGSNLLKASATIFDSVEKALSTIDDHGQLEGQLSISTSSDSVSYFTPKISAFIKRHPGVKLRHYIHTSDYTLRLVNSGTIDIGLGNFSRQRQGLAKDAVTQSGLSLLCLEDDIRFGKGTVRLPDLAQSRIILPPDRSLTRRVIEQAFAKVGAKCSDVIETGSCHTARDFVRSGIGTAIIHVICGSRLSLRGLRQIDLSTSFPKIELSAIYRREIGHSSLPRAFIDELILPDL